MRQDQIEADLRRDEGRVVNAASRHVPYQDSVGKWTIGYGRNLSDVGLSELEAVALLRRDITEAEDDMRDLFHEWWDTFSDRRREALVNMRFNLGPSRLRGFKRMIGAIVINHWGSAAREALDSEWSRQTGERAQRIAAALREG